MGIKAPKLTADERLAWIQLTCSEKIGPITFKKLIEKFGSARSALKTLSRLHTNQKFYPVQDAEQELKAHDKFGAELILSCDSTYPDTLKAIRDAPPLLSAFGQINILHKPCLAIVGARNASLNSKRFTEHIARDLGQAGWIIVSGLARGIDTAAHLGALETGTIAVLAGGVDHIYPEENTQLYHTIAKTGMILSESPLGTQPQPHFFPRRNRIISGLCKGVLIVEAAQKSGSLITANMALEQGREVFAVPGSPMDPRSRGTNSLIQNGATLVQSAEDIVKEFASEPKIAPSLNPEITIANEDLISTLEENFDTISKKILENLSPTPVTLDELTRQCEASPETILWGILELELSGKVQRLPGNQIALQ